MRRSTVDPIGYSLLVEVRNFSDQAVETRLTINLDETLVDVVPLEIEPNGVFQKQIESTARAGGILTGKMKLDDGLALDDEANAILPSRPEIPVRLVTPEDSESYFLTRVLQSIPLVKLVGEATPESQTEPALTVFSGIVPDEIPSGPVLLVDVPADGPPLDDTLPAWRLGDAIENPIIAKQEKESPLLRHVHLQNVVMAGGKDLDVHQSLGAPTTLLETASGARVCVSIEREQGRILMLATDLDTSDLPLRIAFPVLMTNAMNWFFRESGEIQPALATDQLAEVDWDLGDDTNLVTANLIAPDGDASIVTVERNRARIGPLAAAGIYRMTLDRVDEVKRDEQADQEDNLDSEGLMEVTAEDLREKKADKFVAVNLCNANESDLRIPELPQSVAGQLPPAGRSPWFYLVFLAAGLVLTEWVLFQRRIVA